MSAFVEFKNVSKTYHMGEVNIEALKNEGFNLLTPIIIKNIDDYIKAVPMFSEKDEVQILDNILTIV